MRQVSADGDYIYVEYTGSNDRELYDLRTDPGQLDNAINAVDPALVFGLCLARLGTWVGRLRAGYASAVRARWQQLAVGATGATVEVSHAAGARRGVTCGIDAGGALMVRSGTETSRVVAGEVTWL